MVISSSPATDSRRILALWLPHLPTDRLHRRASSDARREAPLVLAAKIDNALRLSAVDAHAARLGLSEGMPLADARAMLRTLVVMEADNAADAKLLADIADWCDRFTPLVALDPPQGLLLDVTGAAHLFGGERSMLDLVREAIARHGFSVHGAVAGTAMAARALAHYADGAIVAPGEESEAVAGLPVAALMLDSAATHGLRRAGLKTIGQVAGRARAELAARFGMTMLAALDRALGRDEEPISPRRPLPDYMAEQRFAEPVVTQDSILASLLSLATTLGGILEKRGQGARRMEAAFFRADGVVRRLAIALGRPTRDAKAIDRLFRERLDALHDPLDPGFGFDLVRLEASHTEQIVAEAIGFDADDNAAQETRFLVDRLSTRLGAHRVLCFRPQDTHIPEAAAAAVPAQSADPAQLPWTAIRHAHEAPRRPLRLLATPEPIDVLAEVPDGPPIRFRWRRLLHNVARAEGPERIAMEWWRTQASQPTRDYFRVEDEEGRRFWLYRGGLYARETDRPRWYVHGVFA